MGQLSGKNTIQHLTQLGQGEGFMEEASQEILSTFPETLRMEALRRLQAMGVEVTLGARVARVEGDSITFQDGTSIPAGTRGACEERHCYVE